MEEKDRAEKNVVTREDGMAESGASKKKRGRAAGGLKMVGFILLDLAITNIVVFAVVAAVIFLQAFRIGMENGGVSPTDMAMLQQTLLSDPDFLIWLNVASALVTLVVFGSIYLMMNRSKYGNIHMKFRVKKRNLLFFFFLALAIQFALSLLLQWTLPLFPEAMERYGELMDTLQVGETLLAFLYTVMIAPLAEEITYRGVILRVGEKAFSKPVAVTVQALLFGVMHWNLVQGTYAFLLGLLLGYVCVKSESVWPGVLLHLFVNLASFFVAPVLGAFTAGWQFLVLMAGSVAIGILSFRNLDLRLDTEEKTT